MGFDPTSSPLWEDYKRFHTLAVETGDVDPAYPVLRVFADYFRMDREDRIWLTFAHVAYYNLNSAGTVVDCYRTPGEVVKDSSLGLLKLPCGTERRGHRDPAKLAIHLRSLDAKRWLYGGSLAAWVDHFALDGDTPEQRWASVEAELRTVYGNGRWATYKTAEMLSKVNGYPLHAPDMAHRDSSGPRHGLAVLGVDYEGNGAEAIAALDRASANIVRALADAGLPGAEMETVETTLCDFHSLVNGRYYVGHDIDDQLRQLEARKTSLHPFWLQFRAESFPEELLHGPAPDRTRKTAYIRTRSINPGGTE